MSLIPGRPDGSNITLVYADYVKPCKVDNKWTKGVLYGVYRDMDDGGKLHKFEIEDPTYEWFLVKEDAEYYDNDLHTPLTDVEPIVSPYSKLEKNIAELTDQMDTYREFKDKGNYQLKRQIHYHPRVKNSDKGLVDNFMYRFAKTYKNEYCPPTIGFFDIEVDINYKQTKDAKLTDENCPVNVISYINTESMVTTIYVLKYENPSCLNFVDTFMHEPDSVINELKHLVKNHINDDSIYETSLSNMKYNFKFFDDELSLIRAFFADVNTDKLNFLAAWNIAFDIVFLLDRLFTLTKGYSLESSPSAIFVDNYVTDIVCSPEFNLKYCSYRISEQYDVKNSSNTYHIASYTYWCDQMVVYASRNANDSSIMSYKLDSISERVCGIHKLDWSHIAKSFGEFIKKDFKMFVFYNIIDTLVQKCVDDRTGDIEFTYTKSLLSCTEFKNVYSMSIMLVNKLTKEWTDYGYIICNNRSATKPPVTESYPGGFTADGSLLNDFSMMNIMGLPIRLFNNLDDYDAKSLYPNITRQFNIELQTQIGRILIDEPVIENENRFNNRYYTRGGRYIEDFAVDNSINFGHKWLGLGTFEEMYDLICDFLYDYGVPDDTTKDNYYSLFQDEEEEKIDSLFMDEIYRVPIWNSVYRPGDEIKEKVNNVDIFSIVTDEAIKYRKEDKVGD